MATLYTETGSVPVKVRNLSSNGGRIEGHVLPSPGTRIQLARGSLQVAGVVAWNSDGAAGIRFEEAVTVADWLPRGRTITPQQRIDEVVHSARVSAGTFSSPPPTNIPSSKPGAIELMRIKQAIELLADDLANDPALVQRYGPRLQVFDLAAQALGKLATI